MAQQIISFEPTRMLAKGLSDNEHDAYKFPPNYKARKVVAKRDFPTNCGRNASHKNSLKNSPSKSYAQRHPNLHSVRESPSKFKARKFIGSPDFPKNCGRGKLVAYRNVSKDLALEKSSPVCHGTNTGKSRMFNDVYPDNHNVSNSIKSEHVIAASPLRIFNPVHMHPMKTHVGEGIKKMKWASDTQTEKRVDRVEVSKGLNSYGHTASMERKKTPSMLQDILSGSKMGTIVNVKAVRNRSRNLINLSIVRHDHPEAAKVRDVRKLYNTILKNRQWRGNLEVLDQLTMEKKCVIPKTPFGHIPGIDIGDKFYYRSELVVVGLHGQRETGIDYVGLGGQKFATSIVDSGRYKNENKPGDVLIYSGQGGNSKVGGKISDQKFERGNLALANSKKMGYPVRVIYKSKSRLKSTTYSMRKDNIEYVYDGLYEICDYWQDRAENHKMVFKFKLRRLSDQPRP